MLWDFQLQTDKQVTANHPDIVAVDKLQKKVGSDRNIKRKEHKKIKKCQGLKKEAEKMWREKAAVVPVVI